MVGFVVAFFVLLSIGLISLSKGSGSSNSGRTDQQDFTQRNHSSNDLGGSQPQDQGLFVGAMLEDQNDRDADRDWFRKGLEDEFPNTHNHTDTSGWGSSDSSSDSDSSGWGSSDSGSDSSDSSSDGW